MITFRYYIRNAEGEYLYLSGSEIALSPDKKEAQHFVRIAPYSQNDVKNKQHPIISIIFTGAARDLLAAIYTAYMSEGIDKAFLWLDKETTGTPTETPIMIDSYIGSLILSSITDMPETEGIAVSVQMQPLEVS